MKTVSSIKFTVVTEKHSDEDLSMIAIVIRIKLQNTLAKQIITLTGIRRKIKDRENRLIPRKIKETIHFLKNSNNIDKMSYMLSEIWLPNLQ